MKRILCVLAMVLGCGGSDDGDALSNTSWGLTDGSCFFGAFFGGAHEGGTSLLCNLTDGTLGIEEDVGTYSISGNTLTTITTKTTCPATATRVETVTFSRTATTLTVVTGTGVLLLDLLTQTGGPTGGAAATFGCYDTSGTFTPGPLTPI